MPHLILVVDDDADIRTLLRRWLERDGHVVAEAADGTTGLNAALDGAHDIAFIDIGLPVLDGYELARRIRNDPVARRPCLVALTASSDDPRTAFEAGFDAHVFKPVQAKTIAAVLDELPQWIGKNRKG